MVNNKFGFRRLSRDSIGQNRLGNNLHLRNYAASRSPRKTGNTLNIIKFILTSDSFWELPRQKINEIMKKIKINERKKRPKTSKKLLFRKMMENFKKIKKIN